MKFKRGKTSGLKKNTDPDFEREQILTQPMDGDYPPILFCYDWQKVYDLIDSGKDVSMYVDAALVEALANQAKQHEAYLQRESL